MPHRTVSAQPAGSLPHLRAAAPPLDQTRLAHVRLLDPRATQELDQVRLAVRHAENLTVRANPTPTRRRWWIHNHRGNCHDASVH